jgi:indolepyruvate ferredoxin oxidoreductase alpha subunit|uniref:Indolepyruvate oxidoreductase subunit IorA n=1 Tax=candidate division WOR-3 bacterium TaxID=2052148 RepID=A0A7C3YRZ4_UNCW3
MIKLLLGDEACARGAYEAGCRVATAYPGTPSTEILEALVKYKEVYCEWSTNEKVALEVALGAANAGARSLVAMKHVGLNVASDPLFSSAYIGVKAGMVIVTCDDPGMHSSQNEQDNRFYGLFAKLPVLSPSDSQEVKDFTKLAFEISEEFEIPVILRLTTRVSHSKSPVKLEERKELPVKGYNSEVWRTNLLPQFARKRHRVLEEKLINLEAYSEKTPINRIEEGRKSFGIIADGVAYLYARDAFPNASFLKLGMVYPFPKNLVRNFAQRVRKVYVIEEVDPFLEILTKASGVKALGKELLPLCDELNPLIVKNALKKKKKKVKREEAIPRPPALCPGCPHTGVFYLLQRKNLILTGDIGCYTLGALPPHKAMDTCVCMGASITFAHGIEKALGKTDPRRIVALIGDSTFFHMGVPGLINVGYNKGNIVTIVFDNRTTGMTGHQDHPGTGKTLMGETTRIIKVEELARACGIERVYVLDPYKIKENRRLIREIFAEEGPAVIVSSRPCALLVPRKEAKRIISELCNGCKLCLQLGCPAIMFKEEKAVIQDAFCVGCGMCQELCQKGAIV